MTFEEMLRSEKHILSDGSMYELLRRHDNVAFDEHIAHSSSIYDARSAVILKQVLRAYLDIGEETSQPMAITTTTWRANKERIRASASFHTYQIEALAGSGVDYLQVSTLSASLGPAELVTAFTVCRIRPKVR